MTPSLWYTVMCNLVVRNLPYNVSYLVTFIMKILQTGSCPLNVPDIFLHMVVVYVLVKVLGVACCEVAKKAMHATVFCPFPFWLLICVIWIYDASSKASFLGMLLHILNSNTVHSHVVLFGGSLTPSLCRIKKHKCCSNGACRFSLLSSWVDCSLWWRSPVQV